MATGSSIIIWFYDEEIKQPIILVGKESKYVTDILKKPEKTEIERKQVFEGNITSSKEYFSRTARDLEKSLGIGRIQFDTPLETSTGSYEVKYRFLDKSSRRGIIKGGRDNKTNENPKDTIIREVAEEIGMNIPKEELVDLGICDSYQVYSLDIKKSKYKFFIDRIKERNAVRSGEVFDLSFKPINLILENLDKKNEYNAKSKCALELFIHKLHAGLLGGKIIKSRKSRKIRKSRKSKKK